MREQVMIYEVKNSAAANAKDLLSNDSKYFYWNELKFKNLNTGDFIFVVNRTSKWVLFTQLNKKDIPTKIKDDKTIFNDLGQDFNVSGVYVGFVRLEIKQDLQVPNEWQWKSLGSSETTYLNGSRISLDSSSNRLLNIDQLKHLTNDETISQILENCRLNFNGSVKKQTPIKTFSKTKPNAQSEMIF